MADDPEQAWSEAAPGIAYLERQIAAYSAPDTDASVSPSPALERKRYLIGTPEQVADRLIELHHDVRFDHFAYWARLPGLPHTRTLETLRLVAARIMPTLTTPRAVGS